MTSDTAVIALHRRHCEHEASHRSGYCWTFDEFVRHCVEASRYTDGPIHAAAHLGLMPDEFDLVVRWAS